MALTYAILAALLDGEASGYDLAKRFDISIANFWHALPQQLYAQLSRMEREGLVTATTVPQERRPNKRVFALSNAGREALLAWLERPSRMTSVKDELLVRLYAGDLADAETLVAQLEDGCAKHEAKLRAYEETAAQLLKGRPEGEYIRTTRRLGPYLTLRRGITFERENIAWCRWAAEALRQRTGATRAVARRRARGHQRVPATSLR